MTRSFLWVWWWILLYFVGHLRYPSIPLWKKCPILKLLTKWKKGMYYWDFLYYNGFGRQSASFHGYAELFPRKVRCRVEFAGCVGKFRFLKNSTKIPSIQELLTISWRKNLFSSCFGCRSLIFPKRSIAQNQNRFVSVLGETSQGNSFFSLALRGKMEKVGCKVHKKIELYSTF